MKINLLPDETLEDLQCGGLYLIQKKTGFRFGTDAVLLANFARDIKSSKTLDLCTGTGIVPLLLHEKTSTPQIHGLEIQENIASMAQRSVEYNNLGGHINIKLGDLKEALSFYQSSSFDLITCNPPYMKSGAAIVNKSNTKMISRHEVLCSLEDVIKTSAGLLKFGGHLAMVHRPNRLTDVLSEMRKNFIEPKRLQFVYTSIEKPPILFLVDGMHRAKSDIKILPPLVLYDERGQETPQLKSIYGRK